MLKTQLIGRIGQDAIIRTWNGKNAISFSVAHNEKYTDKDGVRHENTVWLNCTLWRDNPKLASYLKKGQMVFIEGVPSVSVYVSKKTGEALPDFQISVRNLELISGSDTQEKQDPELSESEQAAFADAE